MRFTQRYSHAFTLIELLIVLAIAALLLVLIVPKLNDWRKNCDRVMMANQLFAAIELAKSEAIKRSKRVILCGSDDNEYCSGNWSAGFILFVSNSGQWQRSTDDILIKKWPVSVRSSGKLSWHGVTTKWIVIHPSNDARLMAGTFFFQSNQGSEPEALLVVSRSGRVRRV